MLEKVDFLNISKLFQSSLYCNEGGNGTYSLLK